MIRSAADDAAVAHSAAARPANHAAARRHEQRQRERRALENRLDLGGREDRKETRQAGRNPTPATPVSSTYPPGVVNDSTTPSRANLSARAIRRMRTWTSRIPPPRRPAPARPKPRRRPRMPAAAWLGPGRLIACLTAALGGARHPDAATRAQAAWSLGLIRQQFRQSTRSSPRCRMSTRACASRRRGPWA